MEGLSAVNCESRDCFACCYSRSGALTVRRRPVELMIRVIIAIWNKNHMALPELGVWPKRGAFHAH
jgi:hypothetical protein